MRVYLIRHLPPDIPAGVCYGQLDMPPKGEALPFSIPLIKLLPKVDAYFSSPLKRASVLAETLWHKPRIRYDDRLKELHFGQWEGRPWAEIPPEELNPWMYNVGSYAVPGGESFADLHKRSTEWLRHTAAEGHSSVAVVCHKGIIVSLRAHALGLSLEESFKFEINFGEMIQLDFQPDKLIA